MFSIIISLFLGVSRKWQNFNLNLLNFGGANPLGLQRNLTITLPAELFAAFRFFGQYTVSAEKIED